MVVQAGVHDGAGCRCAARVACTEKMRNLCEDRLPDDLRKRGVGTKRGTRVLQGLRAARVARSPYTTCKMVFRKCQVSLRDANAVLLGSRRHTFASSAIPPAAWFRSSHVKDGDANAAATNVPEVKTCQVPYTVCRMVKEQATCATKTRKACCYTVPETIS